MTIVNNVKGEDALDALRTIDLTDEVRFLIFSIAMEVHSQRRKWGEQNHEDFFWLGITMEEVGEVAKGILDGDKPHEIEQEMVQVAAVIVSWLECRRKKRGAA